MSVRGMSQKKIACIVDKQLKKDVAILLQKVAATEKAEAEQAVAKSTVTNQNDGGHSNKLSNILTPDNNEYYD